MGVLDDVQAFLKGKAKDRPQWRYTLSGKRIPADTPKRVLDVAPGSGKSDVPTPANLRARALFPDDLKPSVLVRRYREVDGPTDSRPRRERRRELVRAARAERDALRGGGQA